MHFSTVFRHPSLKLSLFTVALTDTIFTLVEAAPPNSSHTLGVLIIVVLMLSNKCCIIMICCGSHDALYGRVATIRRRYKNISHDSVSSVGVSPYSKLKSGRIF